MEAALASASASEEKWLVSPSLLSAAYPGRSIASGATKSPRQNDASSDRVARNAAVAAAPADPGCEGAYDQCPMDVLAEACKPWRG